ncbi:hypothetical protein SAVIM40S_03917 [Streptomyces avidinii]
MGVLIGGLEPHRPKAGGGADRFRWEEGFDLLSPFVSRAGDADPTQCGVS